VIPSFTRETNICPWMDALCAGVKPQGAPRYGDTNHDHPKPCFSSSLRPSRSVRISCGCDITHSALACIGRLPTVIERVSDGLLPLAVLRLKRHRRGNAARTCSANGPFPSSVREVGRLVASTRPERLSATREGSPRCGLRGFRWDNGLAMTAENDLQEPLPDEPDAWSRGIRPPDEWYRERARRAERNERWLYGIFFVFVAALVAGAVWFFILLAGAGPL
jgi:hypothetical protein